MGVDISTLELALLSLESAMNPPPRNDRERDGAIQRFEYTFELCWKTAKKVLNEIGVYSESPKNIIRDLGQQGWISSVEQWMEFLKARNASSHTYHGPTADHVYLKAAEFALECRKLLDRFRKL